MIIGTPLSWFAFPYNCGLNNIFCSNRSAIYGFLDAEGARRKLQLLGIAAADLRPETISLEDIFIALTGKY